MSASPDYSECFVLLSVIDSTNFMQMVEPLKLQVCSTREMPITFFLALLTSQPIASLLASFFASGEWT